MFPKISNDEQGVGTVDSTKAFLPHLNLGLFVMALIRYCVAALILSGGTLEAQMGGMGGGGFGGPSVLGRAGSAAGRKGELGSIAVFVGAQGVYDTGLSAAAVDKNGNFQKQALAGVQFIYGAAGTKNFRRSSVSLNYQGDYMRFNTGSSPQTSLWNGSNQSLSLATTSQVARRIEAGLSVMAGSTNRAFGGFGVPVFSDPSLSAATIPLNSLFDNRMHYFQGIGQLTFQRGPRLSISIGGGGFAIRRRDNLISVDGGVGRADIQYRISRNQTVGIDYQYQTFQFPRAFGDAHLHGAALVYSATVGRRWHLTARGGVFRIETLGQRVVTVDPLIAELTGVSQASEVSYTKNLLPQGSLMLSRSFRRGSLDFFAMVGPMPGNGLLLTSNQRNGGVSYNHNLNQKLNVGLRFGYSELSGIGFVAGQFKSYMGGGQVGYKITKHLQLTATADRRVASLAAARNVSNNGNRISAGLLWTPSSFPISLW